MAYGTLEVVLVDAKNLHDTGLLTKMDPYVIFSVKTQEKRSTVAKGQGSNPEWNESFLFTVTDDVTEIHLKIMDRDTLSSDDFVGEATVPLVPALLTHGSLPPTSYNVFNKHQKHRGEIKMASISLLILIRTVEEPLFFLDHKLVLLMTELYVGDGGWKKSSTVHLVAECNNEKYMLIFAI